MGVINLGGEVGCMINEGPWIFVGVPNVVKVNYTYCFCFGYDTVMLRHIRAGKMMFVFFVGYVILQAWNTQTNTDLSLTGPVGQVYALAVGNDLLLAGTQVINVFVILLVYII